MCTLDLSEYTLYTVTPCTCSTQCVCVSHSLTQRHGLPPQAHALRARDFHPAAGQGHPGTANAAAHSLSNKDAQTSVWSVTLAPPAGRLLEPRQRRAGGRRHGRGRPRARHVPGPGVHPTAAERHGARVSPRHGILRKTSASHCFILENVDFLSRVLIQDLQLAVDGQFDNGPAVKSHSYTKYNTWPTVRRLARHYRGLLVADP